MVIVIGGTSFDGSCTRACQACFRAGVGSHTRAPPAKNGSVFFFCGLERQGGWPSKGCLAMADDFPLPAQGQRTREELRPRWTLHLRIIRFVVSKFLGLLALTQDGRLEGIIS